MRRLQREKNANLIAGLSIMLISGILYMWSVFQPYVVEHFGWNPAGVGMTSNLMMAFFVIGNVLGGLVQEKYKPRNIVLIGGIGLAVGMLLTSFLTSAHPGMIYLTYSVVSGTGCGAAYCTVLYSLQKWYAARTGTVTGLIVCFFGLSVVILAPLARTMLAELGVPTTFRILSVVFLVVILAAGRYVSQPPTEYYMQEASKVLRNDEFKQFTPRQMVRTPLYWILIVYMLMSNATYMVLMPFITTIALGRGMTEEAALLAVMSTGVGNSLGRIIAPALSDRIGRTTTLIIGSVISIVSCLLLVSGTGWVYIVAIFLVSYAFGGGSGVNPVISTELFGAKYSGTNYGLVMIALAVCSVLFGKISAVLGAAGGNLTAVMYLCAAVSVGPIVLMLLLRRICFVKGGKRI